MLVHLGMVKANLQMLAHNATLIVPNQTFSPAATLRSLNSERCTALYGMFKLKIWLIYQGRNQRGARGWPPPRLKQFH